MKDNSLGIFNQTETWLLPADQTLIAELTPSGYSMQRIPHPSGKGEGVAMDHT